MLMPPGVRIAPSTDGGGGTIPSDDVSEVPRPETIPMLGGGGTIDADASPPLPRLAPAVSGAGATGVIRLADIGNLDDLVAPSGTAGTTGLERTEAGSEVPAIFTCGADTCFWRNSLATEYASCRRESFAGRRCSARRTGLLLAAGKVGAL